MLPLLLPYDFIKTTKGNQISHKHGGGNKFHWIAAGKYKKIRCILFYRRRRVNRCSFYTKMQPVHFSEKQHSA